jgi:hypothetical protein
MRMVWSVLAGLALVTAPSLGVAAQPTYSKGVVTCPDGSKASLHLAPLVKPTAAQLSGACVSQQARKALQPPPPTPATQRPLTREEINRQASGLVGAPR